MDPASLRPLSPGAYVPRDGNVDTTLQHAASSIFPPYQGRFSTSAEAKSHRRRSRLPARGGDMSEVHRVKEKGRGYWVKRIYDAMVDVSACEDGATSTHRARLTNPASCFEAADLEATAHNVFDRAIAVHERGWSRFAIYHKRVVRGKMKDQAGDNLEMRLERICLALRKQKSVVDDAMRGGIPLRLLVDNPDSRFQTKEANNTGNRAKAVRLRKGKAQEVAEGAAQAQQPAASQEEEEEGEVEAAGTENAGRSPLVTVVGTTEVAENALQGSVQGSEGSEQVPGESVHGPAGSEHGSEEYEHLSQTSVGDANDGAKSPVGFNSPLGLENSLLNSPVVLDPFLDWTPPPGSQSPLDLQSPLFLSSATPINPPVVLEQAPAGNMDPHQIIDWMLGAPSSSPTDDGYDLWNGTMW